MTADTSAVDEINRRSDVTTVLRVVGVLPWLYHGNDATGVFHWSIALVTSTTDRKRTSKAVPLCAADSWPLKANRRPDGAVYTKRCCH